MRTFPSPPRPPAASDSAANTSTSRETSPGHSVPSAWRVIGLYALLAGLANELCDFVLSLLFADPAQRVFATTLKTWALIAATAALLYWLVQILSNRQPYTAERDGTGPTSQDQSLLLLQALAENSTDAIFAKDREGRYLLFNRESERITGIAAAQALGRDATALFPPGQAAMVLANDARVMAQDHAETFEEEVDTVAGRATFLASKAPLHDAQGRVVGIFSVSRDITDRVTTQRLLRESEKHYRLLFDGNPFPMWIVDPLSGRFLAVNDAALKHYGYTRDEFLEMSHADIQSSDDPGIHRCKDGRLIDVEIASSALDLEGRSGQLVLAHDVTQKRILDAERAAVHAMALDTSERLRNVLDRIDDGLLAFDLGQRYTFANRRAAQLLGRPEAELLGRHIWTEFPLSVGGPFHRAYDEAMATQQPCTTESYFAPGKRWFEGRLFPSPDGLALYFSDITPRKCAEEALRVSELRYRLAAAQGQVWDWDLITGRVDFPAAFWEQLGYAPDSPESSQPAEQRLAVLLHPEDLTVWRHAMREHIARHEPYDFEYRIRHTDGDWRWFHTQGQAVWDADGRATYMAGTTFEITARKCAEAALRDSEAYRRSVFEQMADAVLLLDRQGRIVDGNPQALAMLGYTRDELQQLEVRDILADFERPRLEHEVRDMLRGQPGFSYWEHLRKDGTSFPVEVSVRALDARRFVAVLRDQTARRTTENALLAYQFELSDLAQRLLSQEKVTTQRLAQALHDQLGQTLAVARLNLDACMALLDPAAAGPLKERTQRTASLIDQAVREVRQVLIDLRPPLLEDQGLAVALDNEIGGRADTGQSTDILIEATSEVAHQRWPADVEYGAFMVAREAIANALQHADASLVRIALDGNAASLSLDVIDDGRGIPPPLMRGRPGHLGIVGMRERSIAIGARFSIEAGADGGTCVSIRWEAPKP